jgi:hypothetical protein
LILIVKLMNCVNLLIDKDDERNSKFNE